MRPTRDEIVAEPAGRRLDVWVAEHVMGWLVVTCDDGEEWYDRQVTRWPCLILHRQGGYWLSRNGHMCTAGFDEGQWSPSADIAAAWEVDQAIHDRGTDTLYTYAAELVQAVTGRPCDCHLQPGACAQCWYAVAHASPEARCKAALLAVLEQTRDPPCPPPG